MSLLDRFQARHREIEARLGSWNPDFSALSDSFSRRIDLAAPTGGLLQRALDLPDRNISSWLPGMPLAALLVAGRRVTVDIAPTFLAARRPNFGIPDEALFDFGRAGMLLFNIRDFDPTAPLDEQRAAAARYEHSGWRDFMEKLLDAAWESIYFLSALRPRIFDSIPDLTSRRPVRRPLLNEWFESAREDLSSAARASDAVSPFQADAIRATFRGEKTVPPATYWHWAYVRSVGRFVDAGFNTYINEEYDFLANVSDTLSDDARFEVGRRFHQFQTRMRFAHLMYSAPLSASFGGAYGYSLADDHIFMQAVEREFHWTETTPFEYDYFDDDLLDLMHDMQLGQLRPRFSLFLNGRHWERLRAIGTETYARTEPVPYFVHYQDKVNRAELMDYWLEQSQRPNAYVLLEQEAEALLADEAIQPQRLFDLAAMAQSARTAINQGLNKHTQGYHIVSTPVVSERLSQDRLTVTNPKNANLLMRALIWLGYKPSNGHIAVGQRGDHARVAYGAGRNYRDNPR